MIKAAKPFFSKTFKWVLISFAVFVVLVSGVVLRLSMAPVELDRLLPTFEKYFKWGEYQVTFEHLSLSYDSGLRLTGRGTTVFNRYGEPAIHAGMVHLALSKRNLLRGKFIIKHATLSQVDLELVVDKEGVNIIGMSPFKTDKAPSLGVIEFLKNPPENAIYHYLKTVQFNDLNLVIYDQVYNQEWTFEHANLRFVKLASFGEKLNLTGQFKRSQDEGFSPASLAFQHENGAEAGELRMRFQNSDTELLSAYVPEKLRNLLQSSGRVELAFDVGLENTVKDPKFIMELNATNIFLEDYFAMPFQFRSVYLVGRYEKEKDDTLFIEKLTLSDADEQPLEITGNIKYLNGDARPDLKLTTPQSSLTRIVRYFPDKRMPKTKEWLLKNVHNAQLQNVLFTYNGNPEELPDCDDHCGFYGSADYTADMLTALDDMPPITEIAGKLIFDKDFVTVTSAHGKLKNQVLQDVSTTIAQIFDPKQKHRLHIKANMNGTLKDALSLLNKEPTFQEDFDNVEGRHVTTAVLNLPCCEKGENIWKTADIKITSDLIGIRTPVPQAKNMVYTSPLTLLDINNDQLHLEGTGYLNRMPVKLSWQENLQYPSERSKVNVEGALNLEDLKEYFAKFGLTAKGSSQFKLELARKGKNFYDYNLTSNLTASTLKLPTFNWKKAEDDASALSVQGRYHVDNEAIDVELFTFTAPDAEIIGQLAYDPKKLENTHLQLQPFKLGRSNMAFKLEKGTLEVMGEALDISGISMTDAKQDLQLPNMDISVEIDTMYLPYGNMYELRTNARFDSNRWAFLHLSSRTDVLDWLKINLEQEISGRREFNASADNAGKVLKIFDLYQNAEGGTLTARFDLEKDKVEGYGRVFIQNMRVVGAPVLVRLLSLLSLEQLVTNQRGLLFEEINVPMTLKEGLTRISKAYMNGPSVGLHLSGDINHKEKTVNMKGSLVPVEGINTVISRVPILGRLLTGSQKGLVVADFSIKGTQGNPEVNVNPFSLLTPGLLKDIFGVLTGGGNNEPSLGLEE